MKLKKLFVFVITLSLIWSLVGCGSKKSVENANIKNETSTPVPTTNPETQVSRTENYDILACAEFSLNSHMFFGDVAWANIKKVGTQGTDSITVGLINKQGELVYLPDTTRFKGDRIRTTPFINGLAAVYTYGTGASYESIPGFVIVNQEGKEVYSNAEDNLYMCGQADDGTFILVKHIANFSTNSWYFCILGSDLTLKDTNIETSKDVIYQNNNIVALAHGLYFIGHDGACRGYLNLNTNSWIGGWGSANTVRAKYGDDIIIYGGGYYTVPASAILNAKTLDDICKNSAVVQLGKQGFEESVSSLNGISLFRKGVVYGDKAGNMDYIDVKGNVILNVPSFPKGTNVTKIDDFSGGYAAVYIIGADKNAYVTLMDENGTLQYEPTQYAGKNTCSCGGYVFVQKDKSVDIIDPNGEHKKMGDDLSALQNLTFVNYDYYYSFTIGGGFLFSNLGCTQSPQYISLDGKTVIDKAKAKYNNSGKLVYTDKNGKLCTSEYINETYKGIPEQKNSTETQQTTATKKEVNYQNISNFNIKGKWKNVGTYTFGQVQSGAIVSFDGKNCNVVSPKDTYAIYKDGDSYTLDCTTLGFSETLSFKVKTVDKNNIHVYYGSNYLELKRVE